MRLAIISSLWPHRGHSVRAANVVIFDLVRALAETDGLRVALLKVGHQGDPAPTSDEIGGREELADVGVEVLPPLSLPTSADRSDTLGKLLAPKPIHFYPDTAHSAMIAAALNSWRADALLVPWSEWLTAACSTVPVLRFAYYGNPDHKTGLCRAAHDLRLGGSWARYARLHVALKQLERVHLKIMHRYHLLGDVAANDAAYYSAKGHPAAFYIRNLWLDRLGDDWRAQRSALERDAPFTIIGNVGKLDATANRYGLEYLGSQVLPALRQRMPAGSFRIEILGSGVLHPAIKRLLDGPNVAFRGFVPDIDTALLAAPVFLCLNNGTPFNVGHTRYLHAWTLGSCVIAHRDASLAMPEIVHNESALLGSTAEEIASLIAQAAADTALRRRIGEGGRRAYEESFRAEIVAAEIVRRLQRLNAKRPRDDTDGEATTGITAGRAQDGGGYVGALPSRKLGVTSMASPMSPTAGAPRAR